jgi:hypothetical protein
MPQWFYKLEACAKGLFFIPLANVFEVDVASDDPSVPARFQITQGGRKCTGKRVGQRSVLKQLKAERIRLANYQRGTHTVEPHATAGFIEEIQESANM